MAPVSATASDRSPPKGPHARQFLAVSYTSWRTLRYVVAILPLVHITSYLERHLMGLLIATVRDYLHVSDTQVSLLQGMTLALV